MSVSPTYGIRPTYGNKGTSGSTITCVVILLHGTRSKSINIHFIMEALKQPETVSFTGNIDANWKSFKQRFSLYMTAIGADTKSDGRKVALLLTCTGQQAIDVYNTFDLPDEVVITPARDSVPAVIRGPKYETVLGRFDAYCAPRTNETYERYIFRCRRQGEGETFDAFVTDLKLKSRTCNYGDLSEGLIRDQVVYGIRSDKLRERLLREADLTLTKAVELCKASELSQLHMTAFTGSETQTVHGVTQKNGRRRKPQFDTKRDTRVDKNTDTEQKDKLSVCNKCGTMHAKNRCPAHGKICNWCKNMNHFASQCIFRKKKHGNQSGQQGQRNIHGVEYDDDNQYEYSEELFCGTIECVETADVMTPDAEFEVKNATDQADQKPGMHAPGCSNKRDWVLPVKIHDQSVVSFKVDTGAQTNLLPASVYYKLKQKPPMLKRDIVLKAYNGTTIPDKGSCELTVEHRGEKHVAVFVLVDEGMSPVLGLNTSEQLGIVKRVETVNSDFVFDDDVKTDVEQQYPDLFKGIGCLPVKHTIRLKEGAVPTVDPERKVSVPMREKLKQALDKMVDLNVIKKVDEPTPWVSSPAITRKKNGEIRVCLDPQRLNESILREHYHIPLNSELTSDMTNAKYFSKLDAKMAFWQIPLDEESQLLCTFNTPFGRYCYLRLPYGITSAAEVFHKTLAQLFDDIAGVKVYVDDLIVYGTSRHEHDARLKQVLERAQKSGLVLNADKCEYRVSQIKYLGEIISDEGVRPDPEKVEAITHMPTPQNKTDLQRFFGMLNYVRKFIPNLATESVSLRSLLEDKTAWSWNREHQLEWERLKQLLITAPVLKHYDVSKPTKITTDASKSGLGAVLQQKHEQHWFPVAYGSRALTEVEQRYAAIEKETLALLFGWQKFDEYVYGKQITLETDHKPLIAIWKKPLASASPRIQRLMLKLLRYDFEMQWTPGKHLHIPDTLSRAHLGEVIEVSSVQAEIEEHVDAVMESLPFSKQMWNKLTEETQKDGELQRLRDRIEQGWLKPSMRDYYHFRDELAVLNGVILKGTRIVVPHSMRNEMLKIIHEGHLGTEKCRRRARSALYWPGMNDDIEIMTKQCAPCQKYQYQQTKEKLISHQKPAKPWIKLGADLFHFKGREYLLVVDYFSNYPEIALLEEATAECVITHMKSILARHGIPHTIITDNGPQFDNNKFRAFAAKYGFDHSTSSPTYAQSNGMAETGVKIVKRLLKKAAENNEDPYLALLNYRSSPLECGKSPAELLMGRSLRTRLPKFDELLHAMCENSARAAANYDKNAKNLQPLKEGETVRIRHNQQWEPLAKVIGEADTPRSYIVKTEAGNLLKRNRRHLLKTGEKMTEMAEDQFQPLDPFPQEPTPDKQTVHRGQNTHSQCSPQFTGAAPPTPKAATPIKQPARHTRVNNTPPRAVTPIKQPDRHTKVNKTPPLSSKTPNEPPTCTRTGREIRPPARFRE